MTRIAQNFGILRQTVQRIVKKGLAGQSPANFIIGQHSFDVTSNRKNNGRPAKYDPSTIGDCLKEIPSRERTSLRDVSASLNIPLTTAHRLINSKESGIHHHANQLKPKLTDHNKLERVAYCLDHRKDNGYYDEFMSEIFVDEKWFYVDQETLRYYVVDGEEEVYRPVQHKSHIKRVMFLCAVACPCFDF